MTPLHDLFGDRNFASQIFPSTIHDLTSRVTCVGQWHTHLTRTIHVPSHILNGKTSDFVGHVSHN